MPERIGAQVYLEATMIAFCAGRFVGAWLQRYIDPARQLVLYGGCNVLLCCLAATLGGFPSIWAMAATSFFMSIMFPTIFALGLEKLGHETEFASSFIVMAISGAAVVPTLMAFMSDHLGALHWSLFVPAVCYLVVMSFGLRRPNWGMSRRASFPLRKLGTTGLSVTELGFGTAPLGNLFRPLPDAVAAETLAAAERHGFGYYDTAPFYGFGLSERRLGLTRCAGARASFFPPRLDGCSNRCPAGGRNPSAPWLCHADAF